MKSQFQLSANPSAGTLKVEIEKDAVKTEVDPGDYTLVDRTITFLAGKEPEADTKIIASYLVGKTPMFKEVTLAQVPAAGTLVVKVNGTVVNNYTLAGQKVTFDAEPTADADVMFDLSREYATTI